MRISKDNRGSIPLRCSNLWPMGLLVVVAALSMRISGGFDALIGRQFCRVLWEKLSFVMMIERFDSVTRLQLCGQRLVVWYYTRLPT